MALSDFWKRFFPLGQSESTEKVDSPIGPTDAEGADEVRESSSESSYDSLLDNYVRKFVPSISDTSDLINTYRQLSEIQEVDRGIQEITDQAVVNGRGDDAVDLDLEDTDFSDSIKDKIFDSFEKILSLYEFRHRGGEMFRRWYVDSRSHYFLLVDPDKKNDGIQEIRYLDPRKAKKIREYKTKLANGQKIITGYRDFYEYDPVEIDKNKWAATTGVSMNADNKILIPKEHVAFAHSGKYDYSGNMIGWLHQVIRPANQLKLIEDHIVIYRISRAPERRAIYVDVGNVPRSRAVEYVNEIKRKFRKRVTYDSVSGKVKSENDSHSIMEDFWLPRKGNKNTEIQTLGGGQNLGELNDLEYFKNEVFEALKMPESRYSDQGGMLGSRETEISRDELRFHKFIRRLRDDFSPILMYALKVELVTTNVLTEEEWNYNKEKIRIQFREDSYFQELVDAEIMAGRLGLMRDMKEHIGKYFSHEYVMKNIFMMSDEQIETMKEQIEKEKNDPFWKAADQEDQDRGFM